VPVVIVTSDDRDFTEGMVQWLGWEEFITTLVCGDDHFNNKPAPDMALAACQHVSVSPAKAAIVGDSAVDLIMGIRAGLGLRVGVTTGVSQKNDLTPYADIVLDDLTQVRVGSGEREGA